MSMHDHANHHQERPQRSFLTSRATLVLLGFGVIAGALLFTEHRAHVLGALIYLPLLLCLGMHFFMHSGHGGHAGHGSHGKQDPQRSES
jgi:hypothetical protein